MASVRIASLELLWTRPSWPESQLLVPYPPGDIR